VQLYYIRWPNGDHTIAAACSKSELLDMLDCEGDPRSARLAIFEEPFAVEVERGEGDEDEYRLHAASYDHTHELLDTCLGLGDDELVSGEAFFRECKQRTDF
jgi:hypothetical protein